MSDKNSASFISCRHHLGQNIQDWTKQNLMKTAFKKFERVWSTSHLQRSSNHCKLLTIPVPIIDKEIKLT